MKIVTLTDHFLMTTNLSQDESERFIWYNARIMVSVAECNDG
jgi:hypothetical protein